MMRNRDTWDEAAARATFSFYEIVRPVPVRVRAGGYGMSPGGTASLEVLSMIDTDEVSVRTTRPDHPLPVGTRLRRLLTERLWHVVIDGTVAAVLPATIELLADDRLIPVDGTPTLFEGVRIGGLDGWSGVASLGTTDIDIQFAADHRDIEIATCNTRTLSAT